MVQDDILVDAAGNARIVDFGLATVARDSGSVESAGEDRNAISRYTAPEILKGIGRHSKESDVFAFGMVVIEVGGGNPTPRETSSSLGSGFHREAPVQ